jgi:hypothetical protein
MPGQPPFSSCAALVYADRDEDRMATRVFSGMGGARLGLGRLGRVERTRSMVERTFLHPQEPRMLGSSCQMALMFTTAITTTHQIQVPKKIDGGTL